MPSKEFLKYQSNIPTAPPSPESMPIPGGAPPQQGGPNAYPGLSGGDFGVPTLPADYVAPDPVIPQGFRGGRIRIGGVDGMHLTGNGVKEKSAMLYLHGGGFTIGSAMTAGNLLGLFAIKCGLEGFAVEYGLAPWRPFPQGVLDCVAFYKGLLDMGYERIVVGGESAGASLTLSLALACKEQGLPLPAVLWCSSPVDQVEFYKAKIYKEDFLSQSSRKIKDVYAKDADPADPLLSPIFGDFEGFPPMVIQTGGGESLAAGAVRLAAKAAAANVEVMLHFGKDMPHTFAMDYPHYPEAAFAMDEIITFINNQLSLS